MSMSSHHLPYGRAKIEYCQGNFQRFGSDIPNELARPGELSVIMKPKCQSRKRQGGQQAPNFLHVHTYYPQSTVSHIHSSTTLLIKPRCHHSNALPTSSVVSCSSCVGLVGTGRSLRQQAKVRSPYFPNFYTLLILFYEIQILLATGRPQRRPTSMTVRRSNVPYRGPSRREEEQAPGRARQYPRNAALGMGTMLISNRTGAR
jgi:hypothetical protein